MSKLLRADFYRMYRGKMFWICLGAMLASAIMFIIMQYTAMDYVVELDRVIFLPMSFYGLAVAALIAYFIGDDFHDGVIRNKLVAGSSRSSVYFSNLICSWTACLAVYGVTVAVTTAIGLQLFENSISLVKYLQFFILGLFTCLALGSIYGMLSMLLGERTRAVVVCMGLAFFMLFLCLHTNQRIVQEPYKNGLLNPHYVGGVKRVIYEFIHDLNPCGQVAQLTSMEFLNPIRWIGLDILWIGLAGVIGNLLFLKKDIK